jgi:twitching motility protein PilT
MEPVEMLHAILTEGVKAGASDVHIKQDAPVILRIARQLVAMECPYPNAEWMEKVIAHMVPPHNKAKFEELRETDFSFYVPGIGRYRTNIYQQRGTFAIAMRHVKTKVPSFEELGLPLVIKKIAEAPRGIVLLAGTTGSGKSTTLAAMIEHINENFRRHIITLEDPIEYVFEDNQSVIEQREIGLDTQSFATGLRNMLREDPDVVMIGEMRDATSFAAAISAADTGHLVLTTVHTTNAAQSVLRVLDFFSAEEREQIRRQLAATLKAVICQRMVGTVDGGMTPAVEILINTPTVRKLIEDNRLETLPAAIETGLDDGMQNFNHHLLELVKSGKVTEKEALSKAANPQALEMNLRGIFLSQGARILG